MIKSKNFNNFLFKTQVESLNDYSKTSKQRENNSNVEFNMSKIISQKRFVIDSRAQIQVKKFKRSKKIMLKNDESNDEDKNRASTQIVMSNHIQMISLLSQFVILSIIVSNSNHDTYQIIVNLNFVKKSENLWIVFSKRVAKMKQQITHLIYDTNVENYVELDLKMMIT